MPKGCKPTINFSQTDQKSTNLVRNSLLKVCHFLAIGRQFPPGTPVSSTSETAISCIIIIITALILPWLLLRRYKPQQTKLFHAPIIISWNPHVVWAGIYWWEFHLGAVQIPCTWLDASSCFFAFQFLCFQHVSDPLSPLSAPQGDCLPSLIVTLKNSSCLFQILSVLTNVFSLRLVLCMRLRFYLSLHAINFVWRVPTFSRTLQHLSVIVRSISPALTTPEIIMCLVLSLLCNITPKYFYIYPQRQQWHHPT